MTVLVAGCVDSAPTRADQQAADQERCSAYGYAPGSDAFADCMMRRDEHRERRVERDQAKWDRIRQQALDRSGDDRYPICSAANMEARLDTAGNFWYAEGCRAR